MSEPDRKDASAHAARKPLLTRVLDAISWCCAGLAGLCMVALIIIFGWLVFGRYVLNNTPTWVEQVSLLLVVYAAFLGAAVGVREGFHLSIDFIREAMPRGLRLAMRALADVGIIAFGGFMAAYGWSLALMNLDRPIPLIGLSESWRAAPLAASGALIVVFGVGDLIERLLLGAEDPIYQPGADDALTSEELV